MVNRRVRARGTKSTRGAPEEHTRNTRGTHEEHTRNTRGTHEEHTRASPGHPACKWLEGGLDQLVSWPHAPSFRPSGLLKPPAHGRDRLRGPPPRRGRGAGR